MDAHWLLFYLIHKNLSLDGNPVAEKDVLAKKIKKLVPGLQIFNARPIDKATKNTAVDPDENLSADARDIDKKGRKMKEDKPNIPTTEDEENENTTLTVEKKLKRKPTGVMERPVTGGEETTKSKKLKHDEETTRLDATDDSDKKEKRIDNDEDRKEGKKNKKVKSKTKGSSAVELLSPEAEIGLGGPSAW